MKKILTLATVALLMTGVAFAGEGKNCGKEKGCCKGKKECKKDDKAKSTTKAPAEQAAKKS